MKKNIYWLIEFWENIGWFFVSSSVLTSMILCSWMSIYCLYINEYHTTNSGKNKTINYTFINTKKVLTVVWNDQAENLKMAKRCKTTFMIISI